MHSCLVLLLHIFYRWIYLRVVILQGVKSDSSPPHLAAPQEVRRWRAPVPHTLIITSRHSLRHAALPWALFIPVTLSSDTAGDHAGPEGVMQGLVRGGLAVGPSGGGGGRVHFFRLSVPLTPSAGREHSIRTRPTDSVRPRSSKKGLLPDAEGAASPATVGLSRPAPPLSRPHPSRPKGIVVFLVSVRGTHRAALTACLHSAPETAARPLSPVACRVAVPY
ncbi:hypothetical protein E2C01_075093 [Portunus trituberculatus]|uniref:Uncharacterized protein n=1 Tax=Portunus trituberculatus TaxID=210409 RepID=A0A5B7IE25_PORTR|nr:hypothetical protein [Portunus trituberculatus]